MTAQAAAPVPAREHPKAITAGQLATLCSVDRGSARRWLSAGLVPGAELTPGGFWVILTEGLDFLPDPGDRLLSPRRARETMRISRSQLELMGRRQILAVYRLPGGQRRYSEAQAQKITAARDSRAVSR